MKRALGERRILITEDHITEDHAFGELVFARGRSSTGVVLVNFHSRPRWAKPTTVVEAVAKLGERLSDGFAVVEPGRVRIASRPRR
jgi:hypothetical protein